MLSFSFTPDFSVSVATSFVFAITSSIYTARFSLFLTRLLSSFFRCVHYSSCWLWFSSCHTVLCVLDFCFWTPCHCSAFSFTWQQFIHFLHLPSSWVWICFGFPCTLCERKTGMSGFRMWSSPCLDFMEGTGVQVCYPGNWKLSLVVFVSYYTSAIFTHTLTCWLVT